MADNLKVLGQLDPSATTTTVLYTVPDMTQTTVSSIVAANRTGSAITFRLSVHVAGAGAAAEGTRRVMEKAGGGEVIRKPSKCLNGIAIRGKTRAPHRPRSKHR